jgi:hypothetical protein
MRPPTVPIDESGAARAVARARAVFAGAALVAAACAPEPAPTSPVDDPAAWDVDASVDWVPRPAAARPLLAVDAPVDDVAVELFAGETYVAYAAAGAIVVVASPDDGATWRDETTIGPSLGPSSPRLVVVDDALWLVLAAAEAPSSLRRTARRGPGDWSPLARFGAVGEAPWEAKARADVGLLSTTVGDRAHLRTSTGEGPWTHVDPQRPDVTAGATQPSFELSAGGALHAVLRSALGGGHGSPVCTATAGDLAAWTCVEEIAGLRVVDPHLLRHGDDLYVVARAEGATETTLYALDVDEARLEPLFDLAVGGAARRTGLHTFVVVGPTDDGVGAVDVAFNAPAR